MSGGIEWALPLFPGVESDMELSVRDPSQGETSVLDSSEPFNVVVRWDIPSTVVGGLGGEFRIRVFAESIGPGQEKQIGTDTIVPVVALQDSYNKVIAIPALSLLGEGNLDAVSGLPVSGIYKICAVLQHQHGTFSQTQACGYAEKDGMIQMRAP